MKKLSHIFIFTLLCGDSKGFMKALKAFIKLLRHHKENVTSIFISIQLSEMNGSLSANTINTKNFEGKSKSSVILKSMQLYEKKTPTQVFSCECRKMF